MAGKYARVSKVSKRLCMLDNKTWYDMYDNLVDLSFLMKMNTNDVSEGERTLVKWCMDAGLIASELECSECGKKMQLCARHDRTDAFEWRCRSRAKGSEHECKRSLRKGSWFANSHLDIKKILLLTYMWVSKLPSGFIMHELKVQDKAVCEWTHYCRELCLEALRRTPEKIGGVGVVVELEESKFGCNDKWVLGGIERKTGKCFMEVMDERTNECLLKVLQEYVLPGTDVVSDCWDSYDCLEGEVFGHVTVHNSVDFKDPVTGACFNQMKGSWSAFKRKLPARAIKDDLDSHLAEYMWRKRQKAVVGKNRFMDFLDAVISVYPLPKKVISEQDTVLVHSAEQKVERMKQAKEQESPPVVIKTEPKTDDEPDTSATQYVIKGKRFVNVGYLIKSLQKLNNHGGKGCNFSDMIVCGETKEGWNIGVQLSCKVCFHSAVVWMEDPDANLIKTHPTVLTPLAQPPIQEKVPLKKPHPRKTPTPPPDDPVKSFLVPLSVASSVSTPQSIEVPKATTTKQYLTYMPIINPPQTTTFIKQEDNHGASPSTSVPSSSAEPTTVQLLFFVDQPESSGTQDTAPSTATSSVESITVTPDIFVGGQSYSSASLGTSTTSENITITPDINADGVLPVDLNLVKKEIEDEPEPMDVNDQPGVCLVPMSVTSLDRSQTLFASTEIPKASSSASDIKTSPAKSLTKICAKRTKTSATLKPARSKVPKVSCTPTFIIHKNDKEEPDY